MVVYVWNIPHTVMPKSKIVSQNNFLFIIEFIIEYFSIIHYTISITMSKKFNIKMTRNVLVFWKPFCFNDSSTWDAWAPQVFVKPDDRGIQHDFKMIQRAYWASIDYLYKESYSHIIISHNVTNLKDFEFQIFMPPG